MRRGHPGAHAYRTLHRVPWRDHSSLMVDRQGIQPQAHPCVLPAPMRDEPLCHEGRRRESGTLGYVIERQHQGATPEKPVAQARGRGEFERARKDHAHGDIARIERP
jgi:hypothetical protein